MSDTPPSADQEQSARRRWADLGPRFASAAVLVPLTCLALYFGGYFFAAVVGAVFAGAYREWERMVTLQPLTPFGGVLIGAVALSALVQPAFGPWAGLGVSALAALAALVRGGQAAPWRAFGLVFFGLVIVALVMLRGSGSEGIAAGVFLGSVIWLTDTGAFFTGRQVGGERLAPDISPSKTWSGAIGGLALGVTAGIMLWIVFTDSPLWIGMLISVVLSILGQSGDLAESALKRRFRVKDSGDIIPGHGGLMDRLDSLTFGVIFLCIVGAMHAGTDAVARGLLFW
ncbi:phosphatidate cytidylyltransferase [Devosia enhydra]|uniref:Phosphatidate cytidylyltransferase n=1 Tax=Devosia enhydra TaxID=665118 RepID=A0A1K2HUE8_9HYPH|nr:phosphatidate cytidylyltransferase [Devosia enhydra]SFZ82045.1 phosphatidate cytidylyltransferase [Devosia enhydra]